MTKSEFGTETQRWYGGSGRADDLTPERLLALWDRFGHLPLNVWKNAVSAALLEPRWPSVERMDALVGRAEDEDGHRVARERNLQAKRGGIAGIFSGFHPSSGFGKMCQALGLAILDQHLTPVQAADFLTLSLDDRHCAHGVDCSNWVAALRAAGSDWTRMPVRARLLMADLKPPGLELGQR